MSEILPLPEPGCAEAHALLPGFVDGELQVRQSEWLAEHLETCAECRGMLATLTRIERELSIWGQALDRMNPLRPDAREKLAARLEPKSVKSRAIRWIPAAASVIAAAALIAIAINVMAPRSKPPAATPRPAPFIAIPYLPPLDPRENATVVRMNLRVATLIAAGYRITADPDEVIPADVLVGEDGRAHAVRVLAGIDDLE